jgi:hypothetical protein
MTPMFDFERFIPEYELLTRRYFLRMGVAGAALAGLWPDSARSDPRGPELAEAIAKLEPYFTPLDEFRDVSRGNPLPHSLPQDLYIAGAMADVGTRISIDLIP